MSLPSENATLLFYPQNSPRHRLFALWYFTILLIAWNILGHTVLGFEQSTAHVLVAIGTAIAAQFFFDGLHAWKSNRRPRFLSGASGFINSLPPALIPGFAVSMLLYPNVSVMPMAFASFTSIASKAVLRVPVAKTTQHCFNPSNFGICLTLLIMPWVGFAPPYHFTENLTGLAMWLVPLGILLTGIIIHGLFTGRLPLVMGWIGGFILQGLHRSWMLDIPWTVPLVPMTSAAFVVFTLYMIPDPATTPLRPWRQVGFGIAAALAYSLLLWLHLVFGLLFALLMVAACRGLGLWIGAWMARTESSVTSRLRPLAQTVPARSL
jgi:enediyne biosynthesis protein E5